LVAETPTATQATVSMPRPITVAREVDLLGRPVAGLDVASDGHVVVPLRPWEIRTIRVSLAPLRPG
jgi:hypothetical protein